MDTLNRWWQHAMSRTVGAIADTRFPRPIMQFIIRWFASLYAIDMSETEGPIERFDTLGAFFTRSLTPSARPINTTADIVSPADGVVIHAGPIENGMAIQAKGRRYSVSELTGTTDHYSSFATIYLSPRDCHRLFSPVDGHIVGSRLIPGCLYPVRMKQLESIPHLYCRNERLITHFDTDRGRVTLVAVAALNVGSMTTQYDPDRLPAITHRGDWIKTFHLGSTVVILTEQPMESPTLGPVHYGAPLFSAPK